MKKNKNDLIFSSLIMLFITVLFLIFFGLIYDLTQGVIIRNGVFSILFSLGLLYFYHYSYHLNRLDYDNKEHPYRFLIVYAACLVLSLLFPIVDKTAWVFLFIGVSLSLFSNAIIAMYSVTGLLVFSCILCDGNLVTFVVYIFASFIGILVFQDIDQNFKVKSSIFISEMFLFLLEISGFVLLENEKLSAEQFVMPIVNIAINALALFLILKYFNQRMANRYRDKYLELNDQEYRALIALKKISPKEYFRSIHTAYLTERMANAIGCNVNVAKNLAYYHRIKTVFKFDENKCEEFVLDNNFPPEAAQCLLDFFDKSKPLVSKESCIVYLSDKFILALMSAFSKDKNIKIDYEELINTLLEKNFMHETLSESDLTQKDFRLIKEIILKETLYYDFLR